MTTDHVAGGTEAFFVDVQDCYERWDPATPPGLRLEHADDVVARIDRGPIRADGSVPRSCAATRPTSRTRPRAYLDVIRTYSPTRALDDERRNGLLTCIGSLIDTTLRRPDREALPPYSCGSSHRTR